MKKLMLLAVGCVLSLGTAQAQFEDLVQQKIKGLKQLETQVQQSSELSVLDKQWAQKRLADSQSRLLQSVNGPLASLQQVEGHINQTNQAIAQRILAAKKAKLVGRIAMLDAMIAQYQTEGLDTTELEALSAKMKSQVAGL